ncbi:MAG: PAS domain-containing protein [Planctomycetes bacterium]|nr:PAS domain-containing protein [Planctomycetota bacterium]
MDKQKVLRVGLYLLVGATILVGLYLCNLHSYLLFHVISEFFSIAVAFAIFLITWNCRRFIRNNYSAFIGIAFLSIGCLDLVYTLAYQGMGVFPGYDANLSTQLWLASRYFQSISFVIASWFITRKVRHGLLAAGYLAIMAITLASIIYWHNFPVCFIAGTGLTSFKIISEYIIIGLFALAILLLLVNHRHFHKSTVIFVASSLIISIASELVFAIYTNHSGAADLMGHYLKIIAFYLIYRALVKSQLIDPYSTLFRDLTQNEKTLNRALEVARSRTNEIISLLDVTRAALASTSFKETAQHTLNNCIRLIGAQGGYLLLFSKNPDQDHEIVAATSAKLQEGLNNKIIGKIQAEILDTMAASYHNEIAESNQDYMIDNLIGAPLISNDEVQGLMILLNKNQKITRNDSRLVMAFAKLATIALQNFRAVSALRNERQQLENILNSMQDAVYIVGQDYQIEYANPAMQRLFGNHAGKKCYDYLCASNEPCQMCKLSNILNGEISRVEFAAQNGRIYDAIDAPIANSETHAISKLKIMRDITEIKSVQEEIRNLAKFPSENPFPVLRISIRGEVLYANNASSALLRHWDEVAGEQIPDYWQRMINQAITTGERIIIEEDLDRTTVSFAITPVKDNEYVNIYGRDITEYRQIEKQLQQANLGLEKRVEERTEQLQETVNELGEEVREHLQTEEELVKNQKRLRALSSELTMVAERERREIATQMHDSIGQLLAFSKKELGVLIKTAPGNIKGQLRYVWELIRQSVEQTRSLTFKLTSATLYTVGLEAALEELADDFSEKEDFNCHFTGCGQAQSLPEQTQIPLYRAVRELLINAAKHSEAKNVWISTKKTDNSYQILVKDDGIGFKIDDTGDKTKNLESFGLFSLRERLANLGGHLEVSSTVGEGTKIILTTPLTMEVLAGEE